MTDISRATDAIELVAYDPQWPQQYAEEAARLGAALAPGLVQRMEHVGSTAVPGLCAKPIIDILILVGSLSRARELAITPLLRLGYLFWEQNPKQDRLFFVKGLPPQGRGRTHHLHISQLDAEPMHSISFRDQLRAHPADALAYAQLKQQLATRYRHDREGYTQAKSTFVAAILRQAGDRADS